MPGKVLYATAPFMRIFRVLAIPFIKTCNTIANVVVGGLTGKNPDLAGHDEESVGISFTGLLTAEDLVEQIVGEIYDETDEQAAPDIVSLEDGSMTMSGAVLLERAAETLGTPEIAEHEDVDTIGGLVTKELGRMPKAGDEVVIEGYAVTVDSAKGFRIGQLTLRPLSAPESASDEASAS